MKGNNAVPAPVTLGDILPGCRKPAARPKPLRRILLAILLLSGSSVCAWQDRLTVMDYYLDLPAELFYCETRPADLSKEFKKRQIKKKNIGAGYILANSEGFPMEVALFTDRPTGTVVVAVNRTCGAGCMCNEFRLLRPAGKGTWTGFDGFPSSDEIRAATGMSEPDFELVLPGRGTDIKVIDRESRRVLALIEWTGGRFVLKKKR